MEVPALHWGKVKTNFGCLYGLCNILPYIPVIETGSAIRPIRGVFPKAG